MKDIIEELTDDYMAQPAIKAAVKCGDIEDLESHIKVAYKNGSRDMKDYFINQLEGIASCSHYKEVIDNLNEFIKEFDKKWN